MEVAEVTLVTYTTRYREGGRRFAQVARTLTKEKRRAGQLVVCCAVESKAAFRAALRALVEQGQTIRELHFIGHSGMYGIMFGTQRWPEQLSPHEWRTLSIPFAPDAEAFFHACRTARWFAPFFADTFQVTTSGYFWYTTFSRHPTRYRLVPRGYREASDLYVFGCPGYKSHGIWGSTRKHLGLTHPEALKRFQPTTASSERGYNPVAELYDAAFQDIRVRRDEWRWLTTRLSELPSPPRVVDWGAGNGALLRALCPHIASGLGVDASQAMIDRAQQGCAHLPMLSFSALEQPHLPVPDGSIDVVISLLSFRYLDWDPVVEEIHRVTRKGGRFWVIDMVAKAPELREAPRILLDKTRALWHAKHQPRFRKALNALVEDPRWHAMLQYNPMRADHEYRWYLQSRFPNGRFYLLNRGLNAQVLAFDSGPLP